MDSTGEQVRVMRRNVRRSTEKDGGKRMRQDDTAQGQSREDTSVTQIIQELKGLKLENMEGKRQNETLLAEVAALHVKIDMITAFYSTNEQNK